MKKFLLLLLLSGIANAQVTKGTISENFALPNHSFAAIPFDSSEFDIPAFVDRPGPGVSAPVSMRDGARFYAITAGIFFFFGQAYFEISCSGNVRTLAILKNGDGRQVVGSAGIPAKSLNCTEGNTLQVSGTVALAAGEYVTFNVFQDTGAPLPIVAKWCPDACAPATWGTAIKVW